MSDCETKEEQPEKNNKMSVIKTVLLNAFPAGGKSEIRKLLRVESDLSTRFHLGEEVQLDDYPYVKFMKDIDEALVDLGEQRMFFELPDRGFVSEYDWGTLMLLINEDYHDLVIHAKKPAVRSATRWLFERMDRARLGVGIRRRLCDLPACVFWGLEEKLEHSVREFMDRKFAEIPDTLEGKTVFIEFSRGGPDHAPMPLPAPHGYEWSYRLLSDEILEGASVLYVWVTAEMSRAKNIARGQEEIHSIPGGVTAEAQKYVLSLNHTVPSWVMYNSYGCDDMEHLLAVSDRPNTVKVTKGYKTFYLPVARFDNRADYTSFCRGNPENWAQKDRDAIRTELGKAFTELVEQYQILHPAH